MLLPFYQRRKNNTTKNTIFLLQDLLLNKQNLLDLLPKNQQSLKLNLKNLLERTLVLGGIVPGVGFTIAGNLLGQPSSNQSPDITNGNLINVHDKANGDYDALIKHKFHNGKTFEQVQKEYLKANGHKFKNAKLFDENGNPTDIHVQSKLHISDNDQS